MIVSPFNKKLARDLWERKTLVAALVVVLAIGICSFVGLTSIYKDLNFARHDYYQQTQLTNFFIDLKRAPITTVQALKHLANVNKLRDRISLDVMVDLPKRFNASNLPIPGKALSLPMSRQVDINKIILYSGSWFTNPEAAEGIVIQQFAEAHHLHPGDWLKVRLPGGQYKILIVGIAYSSEYIFVQSPGATLAPDPAGYAVIFMPRLFLQEHGDLEGAYNQLLGLVNNSSDVAIKNTMNLIGRHLNPYGVIAKTSRKDQISVKILADELRNINISTTIFPSIFLLVAVLVVNVLITRLVNQQRTIIGTFKAIGIGNIRLVSHYLSFGAVVGVLGGLVGCILGLWLQFGLLKLYVIYFQMPNIAFHFYFSSNSIGLSIGIITAILGSISGAHRAMKLAPAEAMRPESPEIGRRILLERWQLYWQGLSFKGKMIARSIFRNRFRSFVTLASAIAATALLYSSLSLYDSIEYMIDYEFSKVEHQDITLSLRDPLGPQILSTINTLPNIAKLEELLMVPADVSSGPYERQIQITGMVKNNRLFTPLNIQEKPIHIDGPGVVLSKALADILHVQVGDVITVKPLLGNRTEVKSHVTRIVKTYLGLSAYMNIKYLSQLLGNSWVTNRVLIKLIHPEKILQVERAASKFATLINIDNQEHSKQLLIKSLTEFMITFVFILIFFSAAIAISVMLNNSMVSLSERERVVATFSVLGMTRKEIFQLFFIEGMILTIIGVSLGLGAGILLTKLMVVAYSTELYRFPLVIQWPRFLEAIGALGLFFLISYFIIYRLIYKIEWLAVLNVRE